MAYKLGKRSSSRLEGVHHDLVTVVERAIVITGVDFTVLEGVRTEIRQRKLVEAGSSWTMKSRHLTGHAVDLGAWVGGRVDWSWPLYFKIARAMQRVGRERGVKLRWGGAWDRYLTATHEDPRVLMDRYVRARKDAGKEANPDGPHFELPRTKKYA